MRTDALPRSASQSGGTSKALSRLESEGSIPSESNDLRRTAAFTFQQSRLCALEFFMPIAAYLRPKTLTDLLRRQHFFDICRTLLRFAVARMKDAQLQEVASSMTLTTLLSLVPLLAVSLAVFRRRFPSFSNRRGRRSKMRFSTVFYRRSTAKRFSNI